jgi:tetratricopeptide (TPR) repeat protein
VLAAPAYLDERHCFGGQLAEHRRSCLKLECMSALQTRDRKMCLVALPIARLWMKLMRLLLSVAAILSGAAPAVASDEQDCFQGHEPELRIKGCSEIIQRVPDDATAYHNRAVAHGLAGDTDSAIADYSKVIQMVPDNVSAYDNRSRAYASKGDYTHAVEDGIKAHELMAKATAQPIMVTPRVSTMSKVTANAPNAMKGKVTPKVGNNISEAAPGSGWWSWLNPWTNSADQLGGKNAKP